MWSRARVRPSVTVPWFVVLVCVLHVQVYSIPTLVGLSYDALQDHDSRTGCSVVNDESCAIFIVGRGEAYAFQFGAPFVPLNITRT